MSNGTEFLRAYKEAQLKSCAGEMLAHLEHIVNVLEDQEELRITKDSAFYERIVRTINKALDKK